MLQGSKHDSKEGPS
ncbi:hypothetical protein AVEN_173810-1, partial [Araneus ventricosus]